MSLSYLKSIADQGGIIGSVVHGAYGDYYEQMICLRYLKKLNPSLKLIMFFASESRRRELAVFDLSFADEVHAASELAEVRVDRFLQFQIFDRELNRDVLEKLPAEVLNLFDRSRNLKPWRFLRGIYRLGHQNCDIPLSQLGNDRLPQCLKDNGLDGTDFFAGFTIGFLWRYRGEGDYMTSRLHTPEEIVHQTKSEMLATLAKEYKAKILVAGMNVPLTEENRERTDCKYTQRRLAIPDDACVYLKGLNWGLELEIMRRCTLCIVMPSGFSEALFMKRNLPTILVDPPPPYLLRLFGHRMPLFNLWKPRDLLFALRQPHTSKRVMKYLRSKSLLPR